MNQTKRFEVVVAGGGLAGLCAAIASARGGAKTALVHDRPVLGGVASSEMRVTVHGAACHHAYGREGGIIGEILAAERAANHETINENGWTNGVFDMTCYDFAQREPNLTLFLNTAVTDVILDGERSGQALEAARPPVHTERGYFFRPATGDARLIVALEARVGNAEVILRIEGRIFIDATGDGLLAHLGGCEWRMGSEGRAEFDEPHAPPAASTDTMGNSIHIRAKDMGRPCAYALPAWAAPHRDPDFFYKQGRSPADPRGGFWWIEIGVPWHTIHDNETIRHELTRHALGVWDWMKNHDPVMKEKCRNYALDFIGQVPGKRESRRVRGLAFVTEKDVIADRDWPDEIGHGGWFIDLHTPGGLLAPTSEPAAAEGYAPNSDYAEKSYVGPYGIPLGMCIARDLENLFLAGRCVSVSRAALGTVRVMATTALMGQACGTAAARAVALGLDPAAVREKAMGEIQQSLLRQDVFLPHVARAYANDVAPRASVRASSEAVSRGLGPDDLVVDGGQMIRPDENALRVGRGLDVVRAQVIAVAAGRLDEIRLCLSNLGAERVSVPVVLRRMRKHSDYVLDDEAVLARGEVLVPPGLARWVTWPVAIKDLAAGFLRLEAGERAGTAWLATPGVLPGQTAQVRIGKGKRMRSVHGGQAFQVEPAQGVYRAEQVLSGANRPHLATNLWRSEAGRPFPQTLELEWAEPVRAAQVEVVFAGHLLAEVHREPPFFRDPQMVKDFDVEISDGDAWRTLAEVRDNVQRRCVVVAREVASCRRLRLVCRSTHGDPSAAVYAIRVYEERG